MKKLLFATLFFACAAMGLSSCMNGDYDATPDGNNGGSNPLNGSGNGGGGGGGFSWSGTAPMSCKINGVSWHGSTAHAFPAMNGMNASVACFSGNTSIGIDFPENAAPNTVYNLDDNFIATYDSDKSGDPQSHFQSNEGTGGSVLILENDATHVKGKFSFNAKTFTKANEVNITEGYFDISKQ